MISEKQKKDWIRLDRFVYYFVVFYIIFILATATYIGTVDYILRALVVCLFAIAMTNIQYIISYSQRNDISIKESAKFCFNVK